MQEPLCAVAALPTPLAYVAATPMVGGHHSVLRGHAARPATVVVLGAKVGADGAWERYGMGGTNSQQAAPA